MWFRPSLFSTGVISSGGSSSTQEELEETDFLLAEVKPKILIHERDYFRQATRMEAWDSYVLVSVLCTSISYSALQGFNLSPAHEGIFFYVDILETLIRLVAGFACVCGLYSTMVFAISILYGKTALGMERDVQYDDFLEKTQDLRIRAFLAFSLALGFFSLLVILVLSEKIPGAMHLPVGTILIGALFVGVRDWKTLVDSAGSIYFDDD